MSGDNGRLPDGILAADIEAELSHVVGSAAFLRSGQLQRLLRFLVEETLAGRGERLKEYVIAVEVFGRPGSYDPRLDSLVRVEAHRLRAALDAYYSGDGRAAPIIIELQKGSYQPTFRRVALESTAAGQARAEDPVAAGTAAAATARRLAAAANRGRIATAFFAVAVVAAIVAGSVWLLRSRRVTALTDRDLVLLSAFDNATGEEIFDETMKQGLTVVLEQSPFLNIVSDRRVGQVLTLMGRTPAERLTGDVAREACVRSGGRAMVGGSIARLGSHYVIGLTATDCATGDALVHVQEEAGSREAVLQALGRAAVALRERLGESLTSIRQFDVPIEDATTRSLEALRAYSLGRKVAREKGSPADVPFYKRAIELDPEFAVAYAALGISYANLGQPSEAARMLDRARALGTRASERERYRISAYYYHVVTGDLQKAGEAYEMWKDKYPRDFSPYINLGVADTWLGRYDQSLAVTSEALRLEPTNVLPYSNLAALYIKLGRFDEAKATLNEALSRGLNSKFVRSNLCYLAFLEHDDATVARELVEVRDKPGDEDALLSQQSDTEAYFGRLRSAREFSRRAVESARLTGAKEAAAGWLANSALREAEFGNRTAALGDIDDALHLAPGRDVVALAALALARAGDRQRAESTVRQLEQDYPLNTVIRVYWAPVVHAAIDIDGRDPDTAIAALQTAAPYEMGSPPPMGLATLYPVYLRGQAYLTAGQGEAAAREFQKILDHPGLVLNFPLHALARLQLARARALSGDSHRARQEYEMFFDLWKDADADIPVLRAARREYAILPKSRS